MAYPDPRSQANDLLLVGEVLPPQGTFTVSRKEKSFWQLDLKGGGQGVLFNVYLQQSTLQPHLTGRMLPILYSTGAYHVSLGVEGAGYRAALLPGGSEVMKGIWRP